MVPFSRTELHPDCARDILAYTTLGVFESVAEAKIDLNPHRPYRELRLATHMKNKCLSWGSAPPLQHNETYAD